MDKIRIDFFDILGYLIPGSALLMLGWVAFDGGVQSIWQMYDSIHKVDKKTLLIGIFLAYIAGFVLHAIGTWLYERYATLRKKNWSIVNYLFGDLILPVQIGMTVPERWAIIREFGEKHVNILERWYALRALSQNLAASSAMFALVCLYKWVHFHAFEWVALSALSIVLTAILLKRSEIFRRYLSEDLAAILSHLPSKKSA